MGFHIVKRENCPLWKKALFYLLAILSALVLGGVILLAVGVNPIAYYTKMFTLNTIGNAIAYKYIMNYLNDWVPLALTALGLSLAFKMRFWNIGGEGQFMLGALASAAAGILLGDKLSAPMMIIVMCLAGMLAAGLLGLFVAALKAKFDTNETLLTLMLNYIMLSVLSYIMGTKAGWNFFLKPEDPRPTSKELLKNAMFPLFGKQGSFQLNLCVILVLVIATILYIYLKHTKQGYEISVVGDSPGTARYAGMKTNRIALRTVFLSASLIGLAAAFKVGTVGTLSTSITNDVGWTGIVVAWLAQLNTWAILAISALINILHFGSREAVVAFPRVASSFASILQGFLLFWVLAADFMIRFKLVRTKKEEKHG